MHQYYNYYVNINYINFMEHKLELIKNYIQTKHRYFQQDFGKKTVQELAKHNLD